MKKISLKIIQKCLKKLEKIRVKPQFMDNPHNEMYEKRQHVRRRDCGIKIKIAKIIVKKLQ